MNTVLLNTDSITDLELIIALAKKLGINAYPVAKKEMEEMEDLKLLRFMQEAKKEGFADTQETLKKLGIRS